jgi:hypothetical protein
LFFQDQPRKKKNNADGRPCCGGFSNYKRDLLITEGRYENQKNCVGMPPVRMSSYDKLSRIPG